jgi:DNA-binding MarR family transcriptional regulator
MSTRRDAGTSKQLRAGKSRRGAPEGAWELMMANIAVLTAVLNEVEPQLNAISLDHKTVFVLGLLERYDQPSSLAQALSTPKPTITALLKRAESAGFIRRHDVPGDMRMYRLSITEAGKRARDEGRAMMTKAFGAKLDLASATDVAGYERAIAAMMGR